MSTPNSAAASATMNYQLTSYASGRWNDISGVMSLAERLAPTTSVPGASGQYKTFDDINSFKVYNTSRALGGDPTVISFSADDAFYNCKPQALETRVDKAEDQQAGAVEGNANSAAIMQLLDQGKVGALLNATALSHAYAVVSYVLANTTPVVARGDWSSAEVDPIAQINEQLLAISLAVGSVKNIKITMDLSVWNGLRSHPKVTARIVGVQVTEITQSQLNGLLILPCDIEITNVVHDIAGLGQAANKKRFMAGVLLIHYSLPNATVYDPSAFKTFTVGVGALMTGVRTYRSPNDLWRAHLLDWSRDIKKTSDASVKRLDIVLAT